PAPVSTPQYYQSDRGTFARADITYLRQDFSVQQPVSNPGPWPPYQRFDYLVRLRPLTQAEAAGLEGARNEGEKAPGFQVREAILYTLRELTGKDGGTTPEGWTRTLYPGTRPDPETETQRLTRE